VIRYVPGTGCTASVPPRYEKERLARTTRFPSLRSAKYKGKPAKMSKPPPAPAIRTLVLSNNESGIENLIVLIVHYFGSFAASETLPSVAASETLPSTAASAPASLVVRASEGLASSTGVPYIGVTRQAEAETIVAAKTAPFIGFRTLAVSWGEQNGQEPALRLWGFTKVSHWGQRTSAGMIEDSSTAFFHRIGRRLSMTAGHAHVVVFTPVY